LPVSISPFSIGAPATPVTFAEQQLASDSPFCTSGPGRSGITQPMLDNPNSVLANVLAGLEVTSFIELLVSTSATAPILGGGTANTAFLGGGADGPNAVATQVDATFWLLTLNGQRSPTWLLYTQTVLLNFKGLSWPHVSVAAMTAM
jgi:hypothetical protein